MTQQLRQSGHRREGRPEGEIWRNTSPFPLFEIFRPEYIAKTCGYSKNYLRGFAVGRVAIPDKLVEEMTKQTGWTVEQLFGPEFLKEWRVDHPKAK